MKKKESKFIAGKEKRRTIIILLPVCVILFMMGILANCENPIIKQWYTPNIQSPATEQPTPKPTPDKPVDKPKAAFEGTLKLGILPAFTRHYELYGLRFINTAGQMVNLDYYPLDSASGRWESDVEPPNLMEAVIRIGSGAFFYLPVENTQGDWNLATEIIPIASAEELDAIRGGTRYSLDQHFIQVTTIDLAAWSNWDPIGGTLNPFTGIFDGNGHNILNLSTSVTTPSQKQGLFGSLGTGGKLENIHVVNGNVRGADGAGGICGESSGEISNCSFAGLVRGVNHVGGIVGRSSDSGTMIMDCTNNGKVQGTKQAGGIIGFMGRNGVIIACENTGQVEGSWETGGIAGRSEYSAVFASCNRGTISAAENETGGIIGYNVNASVIACYNTADIQGAGANIGGIIGKNEGVKAISACYNNSDVKGKGVHGWIIGNNDAGTGAVSACFWYGNAQTPINGIGTPPNRENAKPFGTSTNSPSEIWPQATTHAEWGTGDGGSGKWWKSLGNWNNGANSELPVLYWE
ncbi:hypothetical protein AGMMS50293_04760 [Spirochaetia bacterium]|nr:hypothetical protein AGMMS50293_04760 [Spirochaetia bacterium]